MAKLRHSIPRRPHPQQRRHLRHSTSVPSSNHKPLPISQAMLKCLVYIFTTLFFVILLTSHHKLPLAAPHGHLPGRVRSVFRYHSKSRRYDKYVQEDPTDDASRMSSLLSAASLFHREPSPRIAIVLPFIGKQAPPYLGMFCTAAGGSASLVDFLIFHPGVLETYAQRTGRHVCPSNVKFINLQSMENLASNYLLRVMNHVPEDEWVLDNRDMMAHMLTRQLMAYPYALVEYKPTFGHVFEEFLQGYSHWGYSDIDIVFGDLSRWITEDELTDFDIVTYGYGDQNRVYLRGQFTFHRNTPKINSLWMKCEYLSRLDQRFGKVLAGEQKLKFESAEGCYSAAVLDHKDIRVKYATKAFTDTQESDSVYSHGLYIARQRPKARRSGIFAYQRNRRYGDDYKTRNVVIYKARSQKEGKALLQTSPTWFEEDRVYRDVNEPLQREVGRKEIIELNAPNSKANCMYWAQKKYQSRLCVSSNVTEDDTVFWINGVLYKQKHSNAKLGTSVATAPFFHFQEWKRYYREGQLATFRPDTDFTTFVLTKEGAIPVYRPEDNAISPLLEGRVSSIKSPIGKSVMHWKAGNAELDRKLLPLRSYCMISAPREFPPIPPAPECSQHISWWDEERVHILSIAPAWQNDLDVNLDVTLVLTLQIPVYQTTDDGALNGLLDIVIANLNRWQGQPSVVVLHIAVDDISQQEDVLDLLEERLRMDGSGKTRGRGSKDDADAGDASFDEVVSPLFGIESSLIAVLFTDLSTNKDTKKDSVASYHFSRKALLNMAIDAAPTRWFVSGLELERGLLLSMDAAFFSHRAALSHQNLPGSIFWIPQFALTVEDDLDDVLTLANLIEFRERGGIVKKPIQLETGLCEDIAKQREAYPEHIFEEATKLWWEIASTIASDDKSNVKKDEFIQKRARIEEDLEVRLIELLASERHFDLFAMDESPILLTDNQGPHNGMLTNEMAREVEEFGGKRCYNVMRLAQLATLGYSVGILPGAFAASVGSTRAVAYRNSNPSGETGEEDESILGASRCDGCFMFDEEHEMILEGIAKDERKRPAKAAVLWEEATNLSKAR